MQERGAAPALSTDRRRRRGTSRLLIALVVAAVVVAVDQITKTWASHRLAHGSIHVIWKLDLVLSYNTGAAFGLARGWAPVLAAAAALVVVMVLAVVRGVRSKVMAAALGLVIGGALGNLADRVFRGHHGAVVDFIALHFWPTFNVADACITVGVILAALLAWREDGDRHVARGADGDPAGGAGGDAPSQP
ncbi:MAG TPA: signal peptidase II [Acidimicrobiales bacterium]|nr:signal peptidase II [Acidimicrobiales bacterium]